MNSCMVVREKLHKQAIFKSLDCEFVLSMILGAKRHFAELSNLRSWVLWALRWGFSASPKAHHKGWGWCSLVKCQAYGNLRPIPIELGRFQWNQIATLPQQRLILGSPRFLCWFDRTVFRKDTKWDLPLYIDQAGIAQGMQHVFRRRTSFDRIPIVTP